MGQKINLEYYIDQANQNSPSLKDFKNQQQIALYENEKIKVSYNLPYIYGQAQWMEAPLINGTGYDEAITNGGLYSAVGSVNYQLFHKPFLEATLAQSNIASTQAEWSGEYFSHGLEKDVSDLYIDCLADQQNIANIREQIRILDQQYSLSQSLAGSGILKSSDVILLSIEISKQQSMLQDLEIQLRRDLSSLNQLCGIQDTMIYEFEMPDFKKNTIPPGKSVFMRQYTLDSLQNRNQQEVYNLKYKPQVSAFADAGIQATSPEQPAKYFGFSIGLNLSIPLFDGHQKDINEKQIRIKLNTIEEYKNYFKVQHQQQLSKYKREIEISREKINIIQDQLDEYKKLMNLYKINLRTGDISVTDFLVTFRNYVDTRQNLNNAIRDQNHSINAYNYWVW